MATKQGIIDAIKVNAGISEAEAEKVYGVYEEACVLKASAQGIALVHGQFLDKKVIMRALEMHNACA
jgi:hypothetical protein